MSSGSIAELLTPRQLQYLENSAEAMGKFGSGMFYHGLTNDLRKGPIKPEGRAALLHGQGMHFSESKFVVTSKNVKKQNWGNQHRTGSSTFNRERRNNCRRTRAANIQNTNPGSNSYCKRPHKNEIKQPNI